MEHVAPIQLALRLLIPRGSRLLELDDVQSVMTGFDEPALLYRWKHPDPEVDALAGQALKLAALEGVAPRDFPQDVGPGGRSAAAGGFRSDAARDDPLHGRALVLLSGANRRAVGSCVGGGGGMVRWRDERR